MKEYNCCVIFNLNKEKVLFCKRIKEPYKGLFNFVGGKKEDNESSLEAAYRELHEETGIGESQVILKEYMEIRYDFLDYTLKMFYGLVDDAIEIRDELNPLVWLPLEQDYENVNRFAGDQNIGHIIRMALRCINQS